MSKTHITSSDFHTLTLQDVDTLKEIYKICVDTEFDVIHSLRPTESATGENITFIDLGGIFAIIQESVEALLGAVMTASYYLESPVLIINTEVDVFNHISRTIYSRLDGSFFWMHSVYGNQLHLVGDKANLNSIIGHPFFFYANKFDWSSAAEIAEKIRMDITSTEKALIELTKKGMLMSRFEPLEQRKNIFNIFRNKSKGYPTGYATPHAALERFLVGQRV